MDEERLRHWVGLSFVSGLGLRSVHKLLRHFGSPQRIFEAALDEFLDLGIEKTLALELQSSDLLKKADEEISKAHQRQVQMLTLDDPRYPALLKEIFDPPMVLYVDGEISVLESDCLSMVGARRATAYGIHVAETLARDLAERGLTVVSGLARGIDSASHRGALQGKGKTIAVLGSGIDVVYPRENRKLAEAVRNNGAILSEFPIGTFPAPQNFPVRNRIISGLSLGTVIVEAGEYSGSLITARLALDQNREVFAVPGNVTNRTSFGPNLLIQQGAKLVQNWQDVAEELPERVKARFSEGRAESAASPSPPNLFDARLHGPQKMVYDLLRLDQPTPIDELLERAKLAQGEVLAALLDLEMKDCVKQLPGKCFVRK